MQSLVNLSILGERNPTGSKAQTRRLGTLEKHESAQASPSSNSLSTQETSTRENEKGKLVIEDENWPLKDHSPASLERPLPPIPPPSRIPPHPYDDPLSNYVNAPADERDDIIEALTYELEHEQYLKTKTRWELNDDYLEELDSIAPTILQEIFHNKITAISKKFFPGSISWELLGTRLAPRMKNLENVAYFPEPIKLPITTTTWDAVQQHPDMTSALFVEGIISNTIAYYMCYFPISQAEGELAACLEKFYRYCQVMNRGGRQGPEWLALTLQMMHNMLYPDVTEPTKGHRTLFNDIKTVEESSRTRSLMWALTDTLRILREAVGMPFGTEEWTELVDMTTDLVTEAFKLSAQWHSKPLGFNQHGMAWFRSRSLRICSDTLNLDLDDKETVLNWDEADNGEEHHVIAVISPILFRAEWGKIGEEQAKIWMKPRLLVAPGQSPVKLDFE
ncbi:hypothetical protein TWF281_006580 [Arthrobotrys megalospora]